MELVNENSNSDRAISLVAEDILDKFGSDMQEGWVVPVDDGNILMNIKHLYGKELDKLLIFLGDWHILKTYQPVHTAGLRELAKTAGLQGENCSNFKCTHQFLLQVW